MRNVSHVAVRGLIFDTGRSTAVDCQGGEDVHIASCEIRNFAGNGVMLNGKNHTVESCNIYQVGRAGVLLRGGNPETLEAGNPRVKKKALPISEKKHGRAH